MAFLKRPLYRRPFVFLGGLAFAAVAGSLFQPYWLDMCNRINARPSVGFDGQLASRGECSPVSATTMSGNFLIGFGLFMLIIGPIIFSLAQVVIKGHNWEASRVETVTSNLPMLSGALYIAAGVGLAFMGT
jgi:hypothetical protein